MKPFQRWFTLGLATVFALFLAGATWFYRSQEQQLRREAESTLQGIAQLKAHQISAWLQERRNDAWLVMENPFLERAVADWLARRDGAESRALLERFNALCHFLQFSEVLLVDPAGQALLATDGDLPELHEHARAVLAEAVETRRPVLSDLHAGPGEAPIHLDVIAPLFADGAEDAQALGAVVMRCDAESFLFPLIQSWPVASRTAESLIIRREGDSVLFLNEIRHRPGGALTFSLPMTRTDLPAVMAANGQTGIVQGRDYRNVEVMAALEAIDASPWFLVAKIDVDEAMSQWRSRAVLILLMSAALLGVLIAGAAVLWHRKGRAHYRQLFEAEAQRSRLSRRYQTTLMSIGDGVIATDPAGRVELLNAVAERLTGWRHADAIGRPVSEVFHIIDCESGFVAPNPATRVIYTSDPGHIQQATLIARNGARRIVANSAAPILDDAGATIGVVLVFRDISQQRRLEQEKDSLVKNLRERVRELRCLIELGRLVERPDITVEQLLAEAVELIPPAWQYPDITCARISFRAQNWQTDIFIASPWRLARHILLDGVTVGEVEVYYMQPPPGGTVDPFLREEHDLLEAFADRLGRIIERFTTHQALGESEQLMRVTLESAPVGVALVSREGLWLQVNRKLCDILGYTRDKLLECTFQDLTHPDDLQADLANVTAMLDGEIDHFTMEKRYIRKDGSIVWGNLSVGAIFEDSGELRCFISIIEDITRRREAEESLHRIEWLLSGDAPRQTLIQPDYGDLSQWNARRLILDSVGSEALTGIAGDYMDLLGSSGAIFERNGDYALKVISSDWCALLDKAGRRLCGEVDNRTAMFCGKWPCHESCWRAASRKAVETGEMVDVECEGGLRICAAPIVAAGEVVGSVNVSYGDPPRDPETLHAIAKRYQVDPVELARAAERYETRPPFIIEIARKRLRTSADLIGRIVERRLSEDALRESRRKLERSNEELEQFAFIASHDMQEPLRTAEGYASLLQRQGKNLPADEMEQYLGGIARGIDQMQAIIDGVLAVARLGSKPRDVQRLDTQDIARETVEVLDAAITDTHARVEIGELPEIEGDRHQLVRVFQNLIENALKFRDPQRAPHLEIRAERDGNHWRFSVKDNGIGIPLQQASRVFQLFGRIAGETQRPGAGIGLAMCKRIIEHHGGRIWFESDLGVGTTFYFTLPACDQESEISPAKQ